MAALQTILLDLNWTAPQFDLWTADSGAKFDFREDNFAGDPVDLQPLLREMQATVQRRHWQRAAMRWHGAGLEDWALA